MKIYTKDDWQYWYDRSYRCWFAARYDLQGNQLGDSIFAYSKKQLELYIDMEN